MFPYILNKPLVDLFRIKQAMPYPWQWLTCLSPHPPAGQLLLFIPLTVLPGDTDDSYLHLLQLFSLMTDDSWSHWWLLVILMTATFSCYSWSHWWQLTAGHSDDSYLHLLQWSHWWQLTVGHTDDSYLHWWWLLPLVTATFTAKFHPNDVSYFHCYFNWCQILQLLPTISTDIGWFPWIPLLPLLPARISYFNCCLSLTAVSYFHTCQLFPLGYFPTLLSVITRAQLCPDTGQLLPAW